MLKTNICKRNHELIELVNTFHRKKAKIFVSNLPTQLKKNCAILPMSNYSAIYFAFIPYLHFCICCQVESSSRNRFKYLLHSVNVNMEPNLNSVIFNVKFEKKYLMMVLCTNIPSVILTFFNLLKYFIYLTLILRMSKKLVNLKENIFAYLSRLLSKNRLV